jgi:hypothetical protein
VRALGRSGRAWLGRMPWRLRGKVSAQDRSPLASSCMGLYDSVLCSLVLGQSVGIHAAAVT